MGHLPLAMFSLGGLLRTGCGTSQNSSLTDFMGPQFCSEIEVPLKTNEPTDSTYLTVFPQNGRTVRT